LDQEIRPNIHFKRIYILLFVFILFWVLLEIRLFHIQINRHEFYTQQSNIQSKKKIKLKARRGEIFDRNGECMATNLIHYDLGVDLNMVDNKREIAYTFAVSFNKSENYFYHKIKRDRNFVYLARKVPENNMQKIKQISDPGLVIIENSRRYYPFNKYGSQIVGFTNVDDVGASGIEMQFEKQLKGTNGWTILLADAKRRFGYNVDYPYNNPVPGANIVLTIDKNYQTIVEDELETGVKKYNAKYGIAILMNPSSGEILAMCSRPSFNPNNPTQSSSENINNRAISEVFEPGSTFKIFPAAALLQENILKPNDIVYCENGTYSYYDHVIHDHKKYGWLTFKKVIENSSNIGMVKFSEKLPRHKFYRYLKNFGFDSYTGIDLVGENDGILNRPEEFSGISKGIISFGQEIGVTALQITNAYCAAINGGYLMRPYIIDKIIKVNGDIIKENKPYRIRQVIDNSVSKTLKEFMLGVVNNGTGQKAAIAGFIIGGKTGTAQKYDPELRRYKKHKNMASFIGFTPLEEAKFVLAIFLDEPKPNYYGGEVAAPIFVNIIKKIIHFTPAEEKPPAINEPIIAKGSVRIPDLTGMPFNAAEELLELKGIDFDTKGEGNYITEQKNSGKDLNLTLGDHNVNNYIPNLKGLTIREALREINFLKLKVKITGKGIVKKQSILPGLLTEKNAILLLTCENR
jgi:cell division protein FtsI (penicillin-binding protein 3)